MSNFASTVMRSLVAATLLALIVPAFAGSVLTGILTGTVTDDDGNPLADTTVVIQSDDGTVTRTVLTSETGRFQSALLPPGDYKVVAQKEGYTAVAQETTVLIDRTVTVLFALQKGELTETITVTSDRPIVEKDNQEASVQVDKSFAEELPLLGRQYQDYAFFSPGVTGDANPNVNGGTRTDNRYLVDGVDTTDPTTNTFGMNLNYDAVEAVDVKTSGVSAEYGNFQGGVLNVITKSGDNDFEGFIRFGLTNPRWESSYDEHNAGAVANNRHRPEFDWSRQWSFNFGGPLVRDRAWYYVSIEPLYTLFNVPMADGDIFGRYYDGQSTSAKFTAQVAPNHKLSLQTTGDPADVSVGYPCADGISCPYEAHAWTLQTQGGNFYTAKWDSILGDTLYLDVNLANRLGEISVRQYPPAAGSRPINDGAFTTPGSGVSPAVDIQSGLYFDAAYFDGFVKRPRLQGNVALTKFWLDTGLGDHTVKFGLDYQDIESTNNFTFPGDSFYGFTVFDLDGDTEYSDQDPRFDRDYLFWNEVALAPELRESTSQGTNYALFLNDVWTLNDHWTFNLGLRGELQTNEQEHSEEVSDQFLLAPRLGLTYDIGGEARHVLKATAGRYVQALDLATIDQFNIGGVGLASTNSYFNCNHVTLALLDPGFVYPSVCTGMPPVPGAAPNWQLEVPAGEGVLTRFFDEDIEPGYMNEFTLGYETALTTTMSLGARVIYRDWGNIIEDTAYFRDVDGVPLEFFEFTNLEEAEREYTGYQLTFNKRYAKNWQMLGVYTLSKAETNTAVDNGGDSFFWNHTETQAASNIFARNRLGLAPWDRKHMLRINGFYNVPLKSARHQFTVGGEFTWLSGYPWAKTSEGERAWVPIRGRSNDLADPPDGLDNDLDGTVDEFSDGWIQTLAQDDSGNTVSRYLENRGSRRWPSTWNLDLSLNYRFNLWKSQIGMRVEVFNLLNKQEQIAGQTAIGGQVDPGKGRSPGDYDDPRDYRLSFTLSW